MERFLTQEGLNMISVLLVLGAAGYAFYQWAMKKIADEDEASAKAEAQDNPPRYHVDVGHAAALLARMEALNKPLPNLRNQTPPADNLDEVLAHMGVSQMDRDDVLRGTSLK